MTETFNPTHMIGEKPVMWIIGRKFKDAGGKEYIGSVKRGIVPKKIKRVAQFDTVKETVEVTPPAIVVNANTHQIPWSVFGLACQAMDPHGPGLAFDWQGNTADRISPTRVRVSLNKGTSAAEARVLGQDQIEFEMPQYVTIEGEKTG